MDCKRMCVQWAVNVPKEADFYFFKPKVKHFLYFIIYFVSIY